MLVRILAVVLIAACAKQSSDVPKDDAAAHHDAAPGDDATATHDSANGDGATYGVTFKFAIVGDTRPATEDDTSSYPTAIIDKIWADIAAANVDFAVSTGDYQFSNPTGSQAAAQIDLYMAARAHFTGKLYPAMGNHECTGYTASNCGSGNANGITNNYTAFMTKMLAPIGQSLPYYTIRFDASDGSYTAKLVVIAANAWDSTQASWLTQQLAQPTTYTFVVRHEDRTANTAPGVTPSETIINQYPLTMRIVGHTHTYRHYASDKEVVCGNGGAPLTSGMNYGYGVLEQLSSGTIQFTEYDYQSQAVIDQFRVHADGSPAP